MSSVSSWSVRVATEARVARRRFSHLRGTSAGGSANPAESVTLEPDVFHTAGIAVFSKMQRTCHPLFIVESSLTRTCQRSRL
ncbi:hypothetical protein DPMN_193874 [Dreissena polymorpha]|uniref:Uncharacterized protein n=1 Tax=Dreissena polymorpha TaxID=45954 RepID=A0A9D3Y3V8_DREPO|nr:hypothetical protein DPMN_193874 [Dreissena polymorpha]